MRNGLVIAVAVLASCTAPVAAPSEPPVVRAPVYTVPTSSPEPSADATATAEPTPSPTAEPTAEPTPTAAPAQALGPAPTAPPTPVPTSPPPTPVPTPGFVVPAAASVPVVASDPEGLVQQLIASERAVRDPGITGEALRRNGHLQQLVYRRLVDEPGIRDAVFALIPADVRAAADWNLLAGAELRAMISRPRSTLPDWRIVEPAPIDELMGYYRAAEAEFGVHWSYLASIHLIETRMGRIRGLSSAGAQGPMQFIPSTWAAYGEGDINSNKDSIRAAARYLAASGYHTNLDLAIWRYNHSYRYVAAVKAYAKVMQADPAAYRGYHQWQVYYLTAYGDVLLPEGWSK